MISSFIEKYKKIPLPLKASFWFIFCRVVQKGIAFISTPIFTRIMTSEEFGTVSTFYSWEGILTVFLTLQLASGVYNKAMIKYEDSRDKYTSAMLFFTSILTIGFFIIYLLGHDFFNKLFKLDTLLVTLIFVQVFFTSAFSFWSIRHRFEYEYRNVVAVTIATNLIGTILSVILLTRHPENRVLYRILGQIITIVVVYTILFIVIMRKGKTVVNRDYWSYSVKYNLPLIPHYLSQQVLGQSDRIMINNMCGASQTAYYSVAYQLSMVLNILTSAIDYSFSPWAYRKIKEENYKPIGKIVLLISTALAGLCFLFSLLAPEVVYILGGEEYYAAVWVIPPVCMSVLFIMMYSLVSTITFYFEKTKLVMIVSCFVAGLNLLLNFIFINIYGFVAAGYTTLVCYIIYFMIHYRVMIKTCKEQGFMCPFNTKLIVLLGVTSVTLSLLCNFLYPHTILRYTIIFFIIILSIVLLVKNKNSIMESDFIKSIKK